MSGRIDRMVVVRGAAGGLIIAIVAAMANVIMADQHPKPRGLLMVTFVGLLVGFLLAGFVAGYEADREVARHGAFAGLLAFVPCELVGILGRLDRGEGISLPSIVILGFLAAMAGLGGSALGARRRRTSDSRAAALAGRPATSSDPAEGDQP